MQAQILSQLAQSTPRFTGKVIRRELTIRGELWVLLQNPISGEHVRLNSQAASWLSAIDGQTTVEQILRAKNCDDDTAQQFFDSVNMLAQASIIEFGGTGEHDRLFQQHTRNKQLEQQRKRNPLAIRIPLLDPDSWLTAHQHRWQGLFKRPVVVTAMLLMIVAMALALVNTGSLYASWQQLSTTPAHWWWYGLLFPFMKLIHECAHAICIKRWGGAVHEAGITLLVLMPIPYVDASDSWLFEKRLHRLVTAAAGIFIELLAVAMAIIVWSVVEPGLISNISFAVIVIGLASTLLFNANPLLRFDGYYILQDLLDIPNLGSRANAYYRYLIRRYVFKVTTATTPVTALGERRWLLSYGAAALLYRVFITFAIALFLAKQFFFIGVVLALMALYQLFAKPTLRAVHYLRKSAELSSQRGRVVFMCVVTAMATLSAIAFMPLPSSTRAQGVVWVPSQAQVFAAETGILETQHIQAGQQVAAGQLLFTLSSPSLSAQFHAMTGLHRSVMVEYQAARSKNLDKAGQLAIDLQSLDDQQSLLKQRLESLEIRANRAGVLALANSDPLIGRFINQGDLLGFLVNDANLVVRTVIGQSAKGLVDQGVTQSTIRLADNFSEPLQSTLIQQIPAANHQLPSPSLAYNGRSGIAVASGEGDELRTAERVFHVELSLPGEHLAVGIGGRAYVNLQHKPESLGRRWWRSARQLLLKQLTV